MVQTISADPGLMSEEQRLPSLVPVLAMLPDSVRRHLLHLPGASPCMQAWPHSGATGECNQMISGLRANSHGDRGITVEGRVTSRFSTVPWCGPRCLAARKYTVIVCPWSRGKSTRFY
jgi:hypothetical protein